MYVYHTQSPQETQPYTGLSAQESFDYLTKKTDLTTKKVTEVSMAKLWAIRITSDIMSIITQPVVLITTSALLMIAAIVVPPVSLAVAIVTLVVSTVAGGVLGFAIMSKYKGSLDQLSKFYAARADLAKDEIYLRRMQEIDSKVKV